MALSTTTVVPAEPARDDSAKQRDLDSLLLPEPTVPDSDPLLRVQTHDIGGVALGTGAACLTAGVVLFAVDAARSDRRHAPW